MRNADDESWELPSDSGFSLLAPVSDDEELSVEDGNHQVPRKSKREKRLERRERQKVEGTATRKGYGTTPAEREAKEKRIAIQKQNIARKRAQREQNPEAAEFPTPWKLVDDVNDTGNSGDQPTEDHGEVKTFCRYHADGFDRRCCYSTNMWMSPTPMPSVLSSLSYA